MRKIAAGLAIAVLLGGCQSIFGKAAGVDIQPVGVPTTAQGLIALEEGREFLRAGDPGSATVVLQIAAGDPSTMAEAFNALGVAYAMLGRGDLAERFFQRAVAENPAEAKFAANLARYYSSREAALARSQATIELPLPTPPAVSADIQAAAGVSRERTLVAGPGTVRVSSPTSAAAMARVSAHEVTIKTGPDPHPATAADGRRRNPAFAKVTMVPTRPAYPIRIDLASAGRDR